MEQGEEIHDMNALDGTLSELARVKNGSEPIVSLYLDVRWNDEQQRERVRLFVQERVRQILARYPPGSPGREGLARTLAAVQEYVAGLTQQAYETERSGLALFACDSIGLWRPIFFGMPLSNALETDAVPHLTQLARLVEEFAPAIVVVPSQEGADLYQVRLGDLETEANLRGFVPRSDKDIFNPGTAGVSGRHYEREKKNERHTDSFVQKNRRAAAAEVTALFDQRPGCKLVLVGTAETLAAFERELPERAREHVVARVPRPREWESGDGIRRDGVKAIADAVVAHEAEDERRRIDALVGQALRGGVAVLGPEDVVLALNEGRVHTLVVEQDFERAGWRCDNCGALGARAEGAEACPYCAGDLRVVHRLGEALVARALAEGGRVEVVAHANKLHSYRGVGAFLRQTAQTGLGGASPPWPTAPGANQS
jgi:peptide subunit release factor 1 (eRF1)